jgi:signal transduction histidine kinase
MYIYIYILAFIATNINKCVHIGDSDPLKKLLPSWMINGGFIDDVKEKMNEFKEKLEGIIGTCTYIYVYIYIYIYMYVCMYTYVYFMDDIKDNIKVMK